QSRLHQRRRGQRGLGQDRGRARRRHQHQHLAHRQGAGLERRRQAAHRESFDRKPDRRRRLGLGRDRWRGRRQHLDGRRQRRAQELDHPVQRIAPPARQGRRRFELQRRQPPARRQAEGGVQRSLDERARNPGEVHRWRRSRHLKRRELAGHRACHRGGVFRRRATRRASPGPLGRDDHRADPGLLLRGQSGHGADPPGFYVVDHQHAEDRRRQSDALRQQRGGRQSPGAQHAPAALADRPLARLAGQPGGAAAVRL
ncbi:MAG: hypothetical protein AVDCRST_MAG90-1049, partial [uncultured Microvirga sp.]